VAALADARVDGLQVGSRTVVITPVHLRGGSFSFDIGTAGSVTLVLQACLPAALRAPDPVELRLVGGTDVKWSPPLDYFRFVFLPLLARMGGKVEVEVAKRGYYPRGGGEVRVRVTPCPELRPLVVEPPGSIKRVRGIAHVANLPEDVAKRMKHAAMRRFVAIAEAKVDDVVLGPDQAIGPGGAIVLWTEHENTVLGSSALAEKGVAAEKLGDDAADEIVEDLKAHASLDVHASDQVLLYGALAKGESRFSAREVSSHAETTMWLLQRVLDARFETHQVGGRFQFRIMPA
jgi:RNA 3'-phosphate cyclase